MNRLARISALLALGLATLPSSVQAQYAPGKGSVGGSVGVPVLLSTRELRSGQQLRAIGKLHFQYVFSEEWRLSMRGGYGWNAYFGDEPAPFPMPSDQAGQVDTTRVDQINTYLPVTVALVRTWNLNETASWKLFGGGGIGVYRIDLMNDRRTISHPTTYERYRFVSPGVNGEVGAEYFLPANRNVSFEWLGTVHYLFEANGAKFPAPDPQTYYPSGRPIQNYQGRYGYFDISFGVNVYFNVGGGKKGAAEEAKPKAATQSETPGEAAGKPEDSVVPPPKPQNP